MKKIIVAALLLAAAPAVALAVDHIIAVQPNALKWGPAPPGLPPGAQDTSRTLTPRPKMSPCCPVPSISRWETNSTLRKVKS